MVLNPHSVAATLTTIIFKNLASFIILCLYKIYLNKLLINNDSIFIIIHNKYIINTHK